MANFVREDMLIACIENKNIALVSEILDAGVNLNYKDNKPLSVACEVGCLEIVKMLIKRGVDPHCEGEVLLRSASYYGRKEIIKHALSLGSDVDSGNGFPLVVAAARGYFDAAMLLIENGADVDFLIEGMKLVFNDGSSPMSAIRYLLDFSNLLVDKGILVSDEG